MGLLAYAGDPSLHSVTFNSKNTFTNWHLVPETRPVIAQPEVKTNIVEIPGSQGVLDLSEALTSYPLYKNRTGDIAFRVLDDFTSSSSSFPYTSWTELYGAIAGELHGQTGTVILADDPNWFYSGRFTVSWESQTDGSGSRITIGYDLEPFRYKTTPTIKPVSNSGNVTNGFILPNLAGPGAMPVIPFCNVETMNASYLKFYVVNKELGYIKTTTEEYVTNTGMTELSTLILSNVDGENTGTNLRIFYDIVGLTGTKKQSFTINYTEARI